MIYLADQLHIAILNTIVHHLDIMASTLVTNPVAARLTIALRRNALEHIFDVGPSLFVATGHQTGAITSTLLTTGDAGADKADAFLSQVFAAAVGVGEVRVAAVNDDVTLLDVGQDRLDEVVNGLAGHDEKHDAARFLQLGAELLDGVGTDNRFA